MKRVKNLVIGGIQTKVFNLILFTVILLTAAYMAVAVYHNNMLVKLSVESNRKQSESIQKTTDTVMNSVIDQSMSERTQLSAYVADDLFRSLKNRVEVMGNYAGKLFANPSAYPRVTPAAPDPAKNGKVTAQLISADGIDMTAPDLADRIGLAGNMADLMEALFGTSAETNSCFVALPDGVFIVTDDRTASKFDEKGTMISYDPRTRPWYKQAVKEKGLIFTDVETDAFTGDIGIVCAMPIYVDGKLAAVVGSDLFLTSMKEAVQASEENGSFVCVINQYGHVVFSPKAEGEFKVIPSSEAKDLRTSGNKDLASMIQDAMKKTTDLRLITLDEGPCYMIGAPVETVGWALISLCTKEAADKPAAMLQDGQKKIQTDIAAVYQKKTGYSRMTTIVLLLIVMAVVLAGALILAGRIVTPLNIITRRISELGGRNLEFVMEDTYRTGDEIEELAQSFASLSHKTVEYLEQIKRVTAEKQRISTELSLATDIQAAMLPHIFPAFPERPEFDIYASMDSASEVGGDSYDYFLIDEDHLCMVIADVSGKGVPAALFMMASKIILQNSAMLVNSPEEVLTRTNEALCTNNEAQMFVTVWLGILDLKTGRLSAANAGHEYPALRYPDQEFELYKDKHGFVIGGMEGLRYTEYEMTLTPGTTIFVYTDGLPEATNKNNELFGTERVMAALNEEPDASPQKVLLNIKNAVNQFVEGAEQFDDLTMLCLEYKGHDVHKD